MRIDSGTIGMESARLFKSFAKIRQSVESGVSGSTTGSQLTQTFNEFLTKEEAYQKNGQSINNFTSNESGEEPETAPDILENMLFKYSSPTKTKIYSMNEQRSVSDEFQKMHQKFIQNILELLFKKRIKNKDASTSEQAPVEPPKDAPVELVATTATYSSYYSQSESTSFQATGIVKTDDGRELNININLSMSSRFVSTYSESITTLAYELTDPLVINLSDAPATLSDLSFFFDLDCDGEAESISGLNSSSGFLAIDKNGDGKINDGSELFGAKNGDGFLDLAKYDEDHNGWIDENDAVFNALKIWVKDSEGNDFLYSLKDKNVGAIYLDSANTQFTLSSQDSNEARGIIRKTGIFLYESGETGTLQHIDLVS